MIDKLLEYIAPHLCSGCLKMGTTVCNDCKNDIIETVFSECILCQRATEKNVCLDHKMRYEQAWIVGIRHGPLRVLIDDFKFQNKRATGVDLAQLLYARLPTLPKNTVLVPIPTTPAHIRERGYDHIGLITRSLSLISGFPIQRVLERGNTATQHFASRSKRLVQAQSAFRITSRLDPTLPYLIIDDVITTGSTIDHASRLLYNAGARQIWIGALARQPLD